MLSTDNIQILI